MTQYVKSTSFTSKDTLPSGNPLKILKGTEIDVELDNIAVAVNSKADLFSAALTGVPTAPTAVSGTSTTQLATTAFATASISPFTGAMLMWPTATAPTGFLVCNGQAVSRATYAALFVVLGTVFGAGDGSTTFTLPDYRDRAPIGAGTLYAANSKGGSKDASLPSHNHTATSSVSDPTHKHAAGSHGIDGTTYGEAPPGINQRLYGFGNATFSTADQFTSSVSTGITVSTSVASAGVSATDANLSPYIGIYFIIKT
jgi:microcystin-dependent protein